MRAVRYEQDHEQPMWSSGHLSPLQFPGPPGQETQLETDAEQEAGAAAARAEEEKFKTYPARSGRCIWPVAHETWGRLGIRAELLLQTCAAAASRHAHRRGKVCGGELRRWRARLDGALQRSIAMQLAAVRRGLPGRRPQRRRPLDLHSLEASVEV